MNSSKTTHVWEPLIKQSELPIRRRRKEEDEEEEKAEKHEIGNVGVFRCQLEDGNRDCTCSCFIPYMLESLRE